MKKLFTLIAAALMAVGANAQTYLIAVDSYPWNYEVVEYPADTQLSFGQWGQFILATGVDLSQYKGVKVEYTGDASTATAEGWVNVKYGDGTDANSTSYGLDANKTETTVEFEEARKTITSGQLAIQGTVANAKILLKSVKLIAADGTETAIASYPGSGQNLWNVSPFIAGGKINFKGQYGGLRIVDAEGKDITYTNDGTDTDKREIVFTFGSALEAEGLIFELNDAAGGFNWLNIDKGIESYTLTLSPETVGSKDDAGNFTAKNLVKLYMKAGAASGYPMAVDIKSIAAPASEGGEEATGATYMFGGITADMITIDANGEKSTTTLDEVTIPSVNYTGTGDYMNASFSNMENVKLAYKNGSSKKNIYKFAEKFTQVDGKNGIIIISGLKADDVVSLFVSAKGGTPAKFEALKGCTADAGNPGEVTKAASVDEYVEVKFTATDSEIQIKETSGGFRISKLLVNGGATGIQETVAPVKVINNGAIYNLAGQKVNESYKGIVIKNGKKYFQK